MFEIKKGVKIPAPIVPTKRLKYPFETMAVKDMFFVPGKERNTLSTHVSTVGRTLGRKFVTRLCYMREDLEGWKPCEADTPGAVLGIGVWRTE